MRFQRIAVALAISAVASIGLMGLAAGQEGQEIGHVDDEGVWLTYGPLWQYQQQLAASDLKKTRREYERCLDPDRTSRNARQLGDLLGGRYRGPRRYEPNPYEIQQNREQCGKEPPGPENATRFYLAEVTWTGSSYKYSRGITAVVFRDGENLVLDAASAPGKCLAVYNGAGEIVPIRAPNDPDPYGFKYPFGPQTDPVAIAQAKLDRIVAKIEANQSQAQTAQARLASLSNYSERTGQCTTPARAALPPRPKVMTDAEIEQQAAGSCVDIFTRRHDPAKVVGALRAVRWDWKIQAARQYNAHPAACANYLPSQADDQALKIMCGLASMLCYSQMQQAIQQCEANVTASCRAPLDRWETRVNDINSGPAEARQTCDTAQATLATSQSNLAQLEQQRASAEQALEEVRASPPTDRVMSLAQARCGRR